MNDTLSVSAIHHGTAIDHIASGQAMNIIQLLSLDKTKHKVTIGLNLPSKVMGTKDIIKIEQRILSDSEANEIVVFAPHATINVIENYKVIRKITTRMPERMEGVFDCPNAACITRVERVKSCFHIRAFKDQIKLACFYCEKEFDRSLLNNIQRHP